MAIVLKITSPETKVLASLKESDSLILGRTGECSIIMNDGKISSKHCSFFLSEGNAVIKDFKSTNGTFLNGNRVDIAKIYLGDVIRIGEIEIKLYGKFMTMQETLDHTRTEKTEVTGEVPEFQTEINVTPYDTTIGGKKRLDTHNKDGMWEFKDVASPISDREKIKKKRLERLIKDGGDKKSK